MPSLELVVDVVNQRLVKSFTVNLDGSLPPLTQGSTYDTTIRTVAPTGLTVPPFVDVDYTGYTFFLGVGVLNSPPSAGTFVVADGSAPTVFSAAIPFNGSALQVQTVLNAVAAIAAAGGVVVSAAATAGAGGPWQVTWITNGARDLLVVNPAELNPLSGAVVDREVTGSDTAQEIQTIYLLQVPSAYQDTFTPLDTAVGVVTNLVVGSGAVNAVQRIQLLPLPYGGTFSVTCIGKQTTQISFGDDGTSLQAALIALSSVGAGNVSVIQSGLSQWDVTFQGALGLQAIAAMAVNPAGLQVPLGMEGSLSLKVAGIDTLVENKILTTQLQIDVTPPGGSRYTILGTEVDLAPSLFQASFSNPTPEPDYSTTAEMNAAIAAAVATEDALVVKKANNGSDFANLLTTLQNLWATATATAGSLLYSGVAGALTVLAPNSTGTLKYLTMTSSVPAWSLPPGVVGSLIKSAAYTALSFDDIEVDTSGAAVTITLPAAPAVGDRVKFGDSKGTFATNNLTIARNGLLINGSASDYGSSVTGVKLKATYISVGYGWSIK